MLMTWDIFIYKKIVSALPRNGHIKYIRIYTTSTRIGDELTMMIISNHIFIVKHHKQSNRV